MQTWWADYYDNASDDQTSYWETFEAKDSKNATEKAMARPGDWMRVDLTITILKKTKLGHCRGFYFLDSQRRPGMGKSRSSAPLGVAESAKRDTL